MQVHPSQISPGESFDIFYFLRNHTDSTTYYVKAVVYDVRTGEVLLTQALTQSSTNTRLFISTVQSPPDPVGLGRNIVAVATVYIDGSFTTKSDAYEEQEQYFLIRSPQNLYGGGGGLDYRDVREIVREELVKAIATIKYPEPQSVPYEALFGTIGALQREVNRIPKEAVDITDVLSAIKSVRSTIAAIPGPEEIDLSSIDAKLSDIVSRFDEVITVIEAEASADRAETDGAISKLGSGLYTRLEKNLIPQVEATLDKYVKTQSVALPPIPLSDIFKSPKPEQQAMPDLSHLTGA